MHDVGRSAATSQGNFGISQYLESGDPVYMLQFCIGQHLQKVDKLQTVSSYTDRLYKDKQHTLDKSLR